MSDLDIDLRGLEEKFSVHGRQVCAVCGFDFDRQDERPAELEEDEGGYKVPLLLFHGKGRRCRMLALCWECACQRIRTRPADHFPA